MMDCAEYLELTRVGDSCFNPEHAAFVLHLDTYHQLVISVIIAR